MTNNLNRYGLEPVVFWKTPGAHGRESDLVISEPVSDRQGSQREPSRNKGAVRSIPQQKQLDNCGNQNITNTDYLTNLLTLPALPPPHAGGSALSSHACLSPSAVSSHLQKTDSNPTNTMSPDPCVLQGLAPGHGRCCRSLRHTLLKVHALSVCNLQICEGQPGSSSSDSGFH